MKKPTVLPALALAAVLATEPAHAVDQASAEALQADFESFFADLNQTYGLAVTPAAPVRVSVKDDSYQVDVAAFSVSIGDLAGTELRFEPSRLRLTPDPDDPDLTAYTVLSAPTLTLVVDGTEAARLSYDAISSQGVWSDALDTAISDTSTIEGLSFWFRSDLMRLAPMALLADEATLTIARVESEAVAIPEPNGLWVLRSRWRAVDLAVNAMPDTQSEPILIRAAAELTSDMRLTGVPFAEWHDYAQRWLPVLADSERHDVPLSRDQLVALVTELPAFFSSAAFSNSEIDSFNNGIFAAEQHDRLEFRTDAEGVLDIVVRNDATGLSYQLDQTGNAAIGSLIPEVGRLAAAFVPSTYSAMVHLDDLPVAEAWGDLIDTADAWIDDPDAAAEVFFRTFANRAASAGSIGTVAMTADWPEAAFTLDAHLAASHQAALGISGSIDGAVTNMQFFTDSLAASEVPQAAAATIFLQALGQREEPADGGPAVTRYRLDIAEDGEVTFNTRDFGPVIRMIEEFFDAFGMGATGLIPDQD